MHGAKDKRGLMDEIKTLCQKKQGCFELSVNDRIDEHKEYIAPKLRYLGELNNLIMGNSGLGVDSAARREF